MKTELLLVIMAGVVLSLFLIVGEVAALRKRARAVRSRFQFLFESRRLLRLALEAAAIAVFFLVQPVIVAFLVAMVLDGLNPGFSSLVVQQLRQAL